MAQCVPCPIMPGACLNRYAGKPVQNNEYIYQRHAVNIEPEDRNECPQTESGHHFPRQELTSSQLQLKCNRRFNHEKSKLFKSPSMRLINLVVTVKNGSR